MAGTTTPSQAPAPQPGLRSYIVYDDLPDGCIASRIDDDSSMPHIRRGECAIIDPSDTDPQHGELFLIEWESGARDSTPRVYELREHEFKGANGQPFAGWMATRGQRFRRLDGRETKTMRWGDGPYNYDALAARLRGKVVGIYVPESAAS